MKKIILSLLVVATLGLSSYTKVSKSARQEQQISLQLSDEQMAIVQGEGCGFWETLAIALLTVQCASGDIWACLGLPIAIAQCSGGDGGPSSGCNGDTCPNGGYASDYATCQQIGGQILGQQCGSSNSNAICCSE